LWFEYQDLDEGIEFRNPERENRMRRELAGMADLLNRLSTPEIEREIQSARKLGANPANLQDPLWSRLSDRAAHVLGLLFRYAVLGKALEPNQMERMLGEVRRQGARWCAICRLFLENRRHGGIMGPLLRQILTIDAHGGVMGHQVEVNTDVRVDRNLFKELTSFWFSGLLAISFCHCKNVAVRTEDKPATLTARQIKNGHRPLTFKILEITPMKHVLSQAGAGAQTGLKRALHICRGHFAHYEEKGLFGKYRGRFWIPQHLRGSGEAGLVVKDYAVRPPKGGNP
jgi:hypothetical protein